jgi:hypothetical protein
MDEREWAADQLAAKLLARVWTRRAIASCLYKVVGREHRGDRRVLLDEIERLGTAYPPAPETLKRVLLRSPFFRRKPRGKAAGVPKLAAVLEPPLFAPAAPFTGLNIPRLATAGALAEWLGVSGAALDWLSDERRFHSGAGAPKLQHYFYSFVPKRDGTCRLLEAPKPRLKAIQRRILHEILDRVPVHGAAHGFVAGRSCLTGARIHAGEAMVAGFDLAEFFPSIGAARVHGIFRTLGYPWAVARRLAGLCTTMTPEEVFLHVPATARPDRDVQALFGVPHLPQGAPTSPALANLLAWRLDRRLRGLADAAGAQFTRYADDLTFSGGEDFAGKVGKLGRAVEMIAREEGFCLNATKTRAMPASVRQVVTGVVVNRHCNIKRSDFDALKAILYNCARHGPEGQNRAGVPDFRAHLAGRIGWVAQVNPARGETLYSLFDRIDWG